MHRKVKLHKDPDSDDYYIKLRAVLYGTGIPAKDVDSYEIALLDGQRGFTLKLYDKYGKLIDIGKNPPGGLH